MTTVASHLDASGAAYHHALMQDPAYTINLRGHARSRAASVLDNALREVNAGHVLRSVFTAQPHVREAMEQIAWYVSPHIRHFGGQPLLQAAILRAVNRIARAREIHGDSRRQELATAALAGLMDPLPYLNEVLLVDRNEVCWTMGKDRPLSEWLHEHTPVSVHHRDDDDPALDKRPIDIRMAIIRRAIAVKPMLLQKLTPILHDVVHYRRD